MTQEEKQLVIKDLCARVPYKPKVKVLHVWNEEKEIEEDIVDTVHCVLPEGYINTETIDSDIPLNDNVILYLRPLSSMTVEERLYFHRNSSKVQILVDTEKIITKSFYGYTIHLLDWLLEHHFDYRGLIKKSLAIVAPEGMYKTE